MLLNSICSYSHNVFYPFKNEFLFLYHIILSSAYALNLDHSKLLFFGKVEPVRRETKRLLLQNSTLDLVL